MRCAVSTQCIRARRRPLRLVAQSSDGHYKAYAEFKLTHYAKAREVWETLAEVGNGDALFNLGVATWRQRRDSYAAQLTDATQSPTPLQHSDLLSASGQHAKATEMYTAFAEQNNADAQTRLA